MNTKQFFTSNYVPKIIGGLAILLVILVIFQTGILVGYRKGSFTNNWNGNYMMRGADDSRSFFAPFMHRGDDVNPHGAVGEIVTLNLPQIMVKGPNRAEQVIVLSAKTSIRNFRDIASTSALSIGQQVIVIGEPNEAGQIIAELIRIMPPPPTLTSSSSPNNIVPGQGLPRR